MKRARTLLGNIGIQSVLVVALGLFVFNVWSYAQAPAKIDPRLAAGADPNQKVNIVVELNFPPERFHVDALQNYGRVAGADGDKVQLRNVTLDGVQALARTYWVKSITLAPNP
ncbi:MAG: hypothetical protein M1482_09440 [Chloroflexi bacterium]|nr:hypothetical protein [Chloroflexota bacterium]